MDPFGIVSTAIGGAFNMAAQKQRFEQEKQLAKTQNQYNIDMWNMQNAYNSPSAQMQRFKDAGLNPNLMYGQGTPGNAQSAPQQVVPNAPDYSEGAQKLAEAFNIIGLESAVADMRIKKENALQEALKTKDMSDNLAAKDFIGNNWGYDISTGKWGLLPESTYNPKTSLGKLPLHLRWKALSFRTNPYAYYREKYKEDMYRISTPINLRASLVAPQASMLRYDALHYPWTFWINNGTKALNAVGGFVGDVTKPFLPKKFNRPPMRYSPNGDWRWNSGF